MLDVIYVVITIGFFALMLSYVRGCELLGKEVGADADRAQERR